MKDKRKRKTKYKVRSYTESEIEEFVKFDKEESLKNLKKQKTGEGNPTSH